jgi:hypothetical protein
MSTEKTRDLETILDNYFIIRLQRDFWQVTVLPLTLYIG